jgi:hypothetical protein
MAQRRDLNGMFIAKPGEPQVHYLIDKGRRRGFRSGEQRAGILRRDAVLTRDAELDGIDGGDPWPNNVRLIRPDNSTATYLVDGQQKRPIRSGAIFHQYQFGEVHPVHPDVLTAIPDGPDIEARRPKVYIGGGDNDPGAFDGYLDGRDHWTYVREHSDGYYINNFALHLDNVGDGNLIEEPKLRQIADLFTRKSVFYETDIYRDQADLESQNNMRYRDKRRIDFLRVYFDEVSYASLAIGIYPGAIPREDLISRMGSDGLQWRYPRPVLSLQGPWDMGGDILSDNRFSANQRLGIELGGGSATDGPMGFWATNYQGMLDASYSMLDYSRASRKIAMVMLAPYYPQWDPTWPGSPHEATPDFEGRGREFLRLGQQCVRNHEIRALAPDIWVISYYAAQIMTFPVTPEKEADGSPAGSITGLAYWLLHHLDDPIAWP